MDWLLGLGTFAAIIGGAFSFAHYANPYRKEIDNRKKMLRAASWNGDGRNVHCDKCGERLTVDTIGGMDEDGNAHCYLHTRKATK